MIQNIIDYSKYYWNAKSIFNIQAPLASDISNVIIKDNRWYYVFDENIYKYPKINHSIGRKLFRLSQYLKPKSVFIFPSNDSLKVYLPSEIFNNPNFDQLIFINEYIEIQTIMKLMNGNCAIVVQRSKSTRGLIYDLINDSNIMLTLNFYDIFVAIQHSNLVKKQQFEVIHFWKKPIKIGLFN